MSILATADPRRKIEQPAWVQPSGGVDVGMTYKIITLISFVII